MTFDEIFGEEMLSRDDMKKLFGLSDTALWRRVKSGELPEPVKLGRTKQWFRSSVERAIFEARRNSERNLVYGKSGKNRGTN